MKKVMQYVDEYIDEFYDVPEGVFCGDAEQLADECGVDEGVIDAMVSNGDLRVDTLEVVNPEGAQHTLIIDTITTRNHVDVPTDGANVRARITDGYPAEYEYFENFEEFKNSEIQNLKGEKDALATMYDEDIRTQEIEKIKDRIENLEKAQKFEELKWEYWDIIR